ncbi:lipoprotein [Mesoplasma tabanidae]|uniref:Spiralin-like protein n=1 Tax=Mesoplasma tabanidae TaxID=219745 RepID=A0A2K8P4N0_9MOLU|nr:lipoprotein [Mesoplasma tabanidae]ATZ21699.1 hypothetical protein MTABA_v1c05010 [Mesoplasma tabanidae]
MKKLLSILGAVGLTATGASVAVSCGTKDKEENKAITIANVEKAVGEIKELKDLAAVNTALAAKLKDTKDETLKGIKSLTAAFKADSKTNVTVTAVAKDGYKLDKTTFDIDGAIQDEGTTPPTTDIKIDEVITANEEFADLADAQAATILAAVEAKHETLKGKIQITSIDETAKTAKVEAASGATGITGTQTIKFTVVASTTDIKIDEVITANEEFADLADAQAATILAAVEAKHETLKGKIQITSIDETAKTAKVEAASGATGITGTQTIKFTVSDSEVKN